MTDATTLRALRSEMEEELTRGILPYWMDHVADRTNGGFAGLVTADGARHEDAPKGSILNARILWTFSAACRALGRPAYADAAATAAEHFRERFLDPVHGGTYWMLRADGAPLDDRKHVYAQSFAIYALSEHFRATGDEESLDAAVRLFRLVEEHAHDAERGGYREAFIRDWTPLEDVRLSDVDADEPRSMNTHLHVLEAYANLFRAWPDPLLRERLREVVELFLGTIVAERGHVCCFFGEDWSPRSEVVSYGHDVETSWLLLEAAEVLGDPALRERAREVSVRMAEATLTTGYDPEAGGLFNEGGPGGVADTDKEWWPQAEAVVGFLNAYQETGRGEFLDAATATWAFIRRFMVDRTGGEWHRRVSRDGTLRPGPEKVGPWKGPYHNGRACLEVMARVDALTAPAGATGTHG